MFFKDTLKQKIFYLSVTFLITLVIIILSEIYDTRLRNTFDQKILMQQTRKSLLHEIENDINKFNNDLYNMIVLKSLNEIKSKRIQIFHQLDGIDTKLQLLQKGGQLISNGEIFNPDMMISKASHQLDLQPNLISIYELSADIATIMDTENFKVESFQHQLMSYLEDSIPTFIEFSQKIDLCVSDAKNNINNLMDKKGRIIYLFNLFRLLLILAFIVFCFFNIKKTIGKITEIIKERDLYTINIKSINQILVEKQDFITSVLNSVSAGIVVVEFKNKKIIQINKAALSILEMAFEDVIDKTYSIIFPNSKLAYDEDKVLNEYSEVELELVNAKNEKLTVLKSSIISNLNGRICHVISFVDITGLKKAEQALRDSEQFNRAIIENSPVGISVRDRNGTLLIANNSWRKIWNIPEDRYEQDQSKRKKLQFNKRDNYLGKYLKQVQNVYENGGECYIPELKLSKKEGRLTEWISHHFYAIQDDNGNVDKVVILTEDISVRKETEIALYEREIRYQTLFEQANDAIFVEDEAGHIIDVNKKACKITGYSRDELISKKMKDFSSLNETKFYQAYSELNSLENFRQESKIVRKDGEEVVIEKTTAPFADRKSMMFLSIVRDVTERKKVEFIQSMLSDVSNIVNTTKYLDELYKAIHNKLGKIIDTTNFYIALYDPETNIIEATYYQDRFTKTIPPPQQMGNGLTAYVIRSQKSLFLTEDLRKQMVEKKLIPDIEWRSKVWLGVPLKNQDEVVIGAMAVQSYDDADLYGESDLKILEFISDQIAIAVERKKAEDKLRESEEKLRAFMDSATDSMSIWDKKGNLLEVNKITVKLLNINGNPHKLLGKNIREIFPAMGRSDILTNCRNVLKTGIPYFKDYVAELSGIGERYFALRAFKVGENLGVIINDITDRKSSEERIRSSLKEKEVMLKEIHHRVKNNMQVVSSLLNLQSRYIVDKKDLELFKESQNRVKSMSLIHEKLYQSKNLASIDFNEYVRNLIRHLYVTFGVNGSHIRVVINIRDVFLNVNTAIPCGLIVNELVSNSLKYAYPEDNSGTIQIILLKYDDEFLMTVKDDGIGLPEDLDIEETESLGLQLVHTLSMQLESELEIIRKPGTSFSFRFKQIV